MKLANFVRNNWLVFLKYALVGVSGTIIDVIGFTALIQYTSLPRTAAATTSFIAAVLNNFTWNRLWTFKSHDAHVGTQFGKFFTVSIGGLLLNLFFLSVFSSLAVSLLIVGGTDQLPAWANAAAKLGASSVVLIYNFLANRFWTFNDKPKTADPIPKK